MLSRIFTHSIYSYTDVTLFIYLFINLNWFGFEHPRLHIQNPTPQCLQPKGRAFVPYSNLKEDFPKKVL